MQQIVGMLIDPRLDVLAQSLAETGLRAAGIAARAALPLIFA